MKLSALLEHFKSTGHDPDVKLCGSVHPDFGPEYSMDLTEYDITVNKNTVVFDCSDLIRDALEYQRHYRDMGEEDPDY